MSSEVRHLLSVDDLDDQEVRSILDRANELERTRLRSAGGGPIVGLLFLSASLRTRAGFTVATARLGGSVVEVSEPRDSPDMTRGESFGDTLRTLSGMVDLLVARTPFPLDRALVESVARCPVVNGGEAGGEHPTQALIDLAAIEAERGPIGQQRVCVCGDLTARSARSLLRLFEQFPPASVVLVSPESRRYPGPIGQQGWRRVSDLEHVEDVDVLYLAGLPEGAGEDRLSAADRRRFALTPAMLARLPEHAIALSPLPVVDEIDDGARLDPRVRMFEQSDRGVWVRVALLERVGIQAGP